MEVVSYLRSYRNVEHTMSFLNCFHSSATRRNDRSRNHNGSHNIEAQITRMKSEITKIREEKCNRLKNLDLFVLDNSIRESTVGQLRGHTLQNKIDILEQVKKLVSKILSLQPFHT